MMISALIKRIFFSFLFVLSGFIVSANSAVLDFTSNSFVGANGLFAGTTYNITAVGGNLRWQQSQDGNTCAGLECARDGLGVSDDEITIGNEAIRIDFGQEIRISGFAFLDLFTSRDGQMHERAIVEYSDGSMFFDSLDDERPNGTSGFRMVTGLDIFTNHLVFSAGGSNDNIGRDDFALAAIVSPVPLPPAFLMFGAALGGFGFLKRWKSRH